VQEGGEEGAAGEVWLGGAGRRARGREGPVQRRGLRGRGAPLPRDGRLRVVGRGAESVDRPGLSDCRQRAQGGAVPVRPPHGLLRWAYDNGNGLTSTTNTHKAPGPPLHSGRADRI
jgi:hypothetical protein